MATSAWLIGRQIRAAEQHAAMPAHDADARSQTGAYVASRMRLVRAAELARGTIVLVLTLGGGIALIDSIWRPLVPAPIWLGAACLVTVFAVLRAAALPFMALRIFVIEARYGFNRTSAGLFVADLGKRLLLGAAVAAGGAAGAVWLVRAGGDAWWLIGFAAWLAVGLTWSWARPVVVAPLFNRFTPLADPALERRIGALLGRSGFTPDGVYVMDGSRRSAHLNASLTGMGRHKRIVFLDTLLERLDAAEIEAVLAHELGHFRLGHLRQRLLVSAAMGLAGFALLGWLGRHDAFYAMLGFDAPNAQALLAFALAAAPTGAFLTTPLRSTRARRQEYEADAFAREHVGAATLVRALDKIHRDNRADFVPDPVFTAFYATHPPLADRVSRLRGQ